MTTVHDIYDDLVIKKKKEKREKSVIRFHLNNADDRKPNRKRYRVSILFPVHAVRRVAFYDGRTTLRAQTRLRH
jgi:hypothetical protein